MSNPTLKTLLLPTGEFLLVLANAAPYVRDNVSALDDVRDSSGSAGLIITDFDLDVEDAMVDQDARRAAPRPVKETDVSVKIEPAEVADDVYKRVFLPNVKLEGSDVPYSVTFEATVTGESTLLDLLYGGATGSLAGLVKLTDEQKAELAKEYPRGADLEPELKDALSDLGSRTTDLSTVPATGAPLHEPRKPQTFDLTAVADTVVVDGDLSSEEPRPLQIGDTVLVTGKTFYNSEKYIGCTGKILGTAYGRPPAGYSLVEIDNNNARPFIAVENLQLVSPAGDDHIVKGQN